MSLEEVAAFASIAASVASSKKRAKKSKARRCDPEQMLINEFADPEVAEAQKQARLAYFAAVTARHKLSAARAERSLHKLQRGGIVKRVRRGLGRGLRKLFGKTRQITEGLPKMDVKKLLAKEEGPKASGKFNMTELVAKEPEASDKFNMTELVAKEPKASDKVYKEECAYCFRTPQDQDGLYVCLSKYLGLCKNHLDEYAKGTGSKAFLNIKRQKVETDAVEDPEPKNKRLQVKVAEPKFTESYSVHLAPDLQAAIPYSESVLGTELFNICKAVIAHDPASIQDKGVSDWDGEMVFDSKDSQGDNLEAAYGPGLTGLVNLGSSCYINSVMQMLLAVPDFVQAYLIAERTFFNSMDPLKGQEDFNWQIIKLLHGMASGDYSKRDSSNNGIRPSQFRRIVGLGHAEFSTAKQQDAEEFIRHLFGKIDENPVAEGVDPVRPFRFYTVTRLVDNASGRVRYATCDSDEVILIVPVPMECATESPVEELSGDPNEPKTRKSVSLSNCLEALFGEEKLEGYASPITQEPKGALQTLRMGSFPKFLLLQVKRYVLEGLELKKLDVNVEMDEVLDLEAFRSQGLQPGEIELPGSKPTSSGTRGVTNGPGKYRLRGFITHIGKTLHIGHYVAHIKKHDVWYIFNDEKVAVSQRPPKAYGYLYLYERI